MPRYRGRAEFRRSSTSSRWVLAGVRLADRFWPAEPGVEPVRRRLAPGLLGWADLPSPILAPDIETAAETALVVAADVWPDRVPARLRSRGDFGTNRRRDPP